MAEQTAGLMPGTDVELGPAERRLRAGMPLHAITSGAAYGPMGHSARQGAAAAAVTWDVIGRPDQMQRRCI